MDKLHERRLYINRPDLFEEIDKTVEYSFNLYKILIGSHKKVFWISKDCNHRFEMAVGGRIRSRSNCPYCCNQRALKGFNDLETKYPELVKEWDFNVNKLLPSEVTAYSHKKVGWFCSNGHKWIAAIYSRSKHKNNCGVCSNRIIIDGINDKMSLDSYNLENEWSPKNGLPIKLAIEKKMKRNFIWDCKICSHEWRATLSSRLLGRLRCTNCYTFSVLENKISDFLHEINVDFLWNKRPLVVDKDWRKNLQIDFQIMEYSLGIEVQDFATHSKLSNKELASPFWGTHFKKGPKYHERKRLLARKQLNMELVDIWEDEIKDDRYKNIILNKIKELEKR